MELNKDAEKIIESTSEAKTLEDSFENSECLVEGESSTGLGESLNESLEESETVIEENDQEDDDTETVAEGDERKDGGSYDDVFQPGEGDTVEVHHMPANNATELAFGEGPAIRMEKDDHRQTASCGSSKEAKEYRAAQKELIDQGKFDEALQMDIDDIHDKFGDKYDEAIAQMKEYVDELKKDGKV